MFGPAVLRQVEGAEDLVEEGEVDREIDVESLAFEPVVPVVEAWGREPVAEPVETAPDIGVEQRRPDLDEVDQGLNHRRCETDRDERQGGDRRKQDDPAE